MDKNLKFILNKYGFTFKKAFGQNFLSSEDLLEEIVQKANVTSNDTVLEIGCGAGALTKVLSKYAKKVIGYEIDVKLKPILAEQLEDCDNVEIVFKDVLKEKFSDLENKLGKDYVMVANLPYYITTPIVMEFIEKSNNIKSMVIMVQEEVADRFVSKENSTDYGAITVAINLRGSAQKIIRVPRENFTPIPNVDSAVVKIDVDKSKFKGVDFNKVRQVVRAGFSGRRKMLINNLMRTFNLPRNVCEEYLTKSNVSLTSRAENLSAEDFVNLTNVFIENGVINWKRR